MALEIDLNRDDEKYVVFKAKEFSDWYQNVDGKVGGVPMALDGAVVIRTTDVFAGPALHAYAANVSMAAHIVRNLMPGQEADDLQRIADYFSRKAVEADELALNFKLPD